MRKHSKVSARERGQRYRRKRERAVGKPKIGRPRGSKNVTSTFSDAMNWYELLRIQGHSEMAAGAAIRNQLGPKMTDIMVQNWRDRGLLNGKRAIRTPKRRNNSGQWVSDHTLITEVKNAISRIENQSAR